MSSRWMWAVPSCAPLARSDWCASRPGITEGSFVAGRWLIRGFFERISGARLGGLWRYRVGDYRILVEIKDEIVTVLLVGIGHRGEVYR